MKSIRFFNLLISILNKKKDAWIGLPQEYYLNIYKKSLVRSLTADHIQIRNHICIGSEKSSNMNRIC